MSIIDLTIGETAVICLAVFVPTALAVVYGGLRDSWKRTYEQR